MDPTIHDNMEESELRQLVKGWVEHSTSRGLRIFVFGKTGVGKSSLINTLLGKKIAEEGEDIYSQTRAVTSYTEQRSIKTVRETIEGVNVTMWDSPGLKDPQTDESQTLKDIKENCKDIDIFVYCTSLTQTRIGQDEYDSIMNLTNALGEVIWKRGLIALTFANEVRLPPSSSDTLKGHFKKRVSTWGEALKNAVKKAGVNSEDADVIPVVPTSYRDLPLPDTPGANWFTVFWSTCIGRTRLGSLPALLRVKRGPLLESTETSDAIIIKARMIADRLKIFGDEVEEEYLRDMIGDLYTKMFENPALLSRELITSVQNMNITGWRVWRWYGSPVIIQGILILSVFAIIMAIQRKL